MFKLLKAPAGVKMKLLKIIVVGGILASYSGNYSPDDESYPKKNITPVIFNAESEKWADSVLLTLSPDEKICQLFMIAVHPEKDKKHWDDAGNLVSKYNVGGIIAFKSGPYRLVNMINYLQSLPKIPLLVSIDGEWGLSMRVDSTMRFPLQMQLGAIEDDKLIFEMGRAIGRQLKRMGIHINFAPVLDVNNNSHNPVINMRSFGDNKKAVVTKAEQYMSGLQSENILAVGKHFPGHGDTRTDSHHDLPFITFSRKRLDSLELYPFRQLISRGIPAIMVAHLDVPALDPVNNRPASLSPEVINGLLRQELGFNGLVFTDALNMKGVTKYFKSGEAALKALIAGNDVILYPEDVPWALRLIKEAIEDDIICPEEIDAHVKRILQTKHWAGLNNCMYVDTTGLLKDLFMADEEYLNMKLNQESITLVKNDNGFIPLQRLDTLRIASVVFGKIQDNTFNEMLLQYSPAATFNFPKEMNVKELAKLKDTLKHYNLIIASLVQTNRYSYRTFNFTEQSLEFLKALSDSNNLILNLFASPYSLTRIPFHKKIKAIIVGWDDTKLPSFIVPQVIFGGVCAKGALPVNVSADFRYGHGIKTGKQIREKYSMPEETGIASLKLTGIDSIVKSAIAEKAFPGCQVAVCYKGVVIYKKSFGNFTYDNNSSKVENNSIYDIASITKIAATTLLTMHLYEKGKIGLDEKISQYIKELKNTGKEDIPVKDLLLHQSALQAWIPFYKKIVSDEATRNKYLFTKPGNEAGTLVCDSLFVLSSYKDSILRIISNSKLSSNGGYKYSDLGFYILNEIIVRSENKALNKLCDSLFYKSMGMAVLGFNPVERYKRDVIVPTEYDSIFRRKLIWGYVHDPGAALLGGVSGHAGLFSNAGELLKLGLMLLREGEYGGVTYFKPATVKKFTSCYECPKNRRGLGFDKPEPDKSKDSPVTRLASSSTFGHQGFTGTCLWVDPEKELVYVFLSNRVYPSAENKKINTLEVRNKIMNVVYWAIGNKTN